MMLAVRWANSTGKKLAAPQGDEAPVPQERRAEALRLAFRKHNDGRFYMSESKWNGAAGGSFSSLRPRVRLHQDGLLGSNADERVDGGSARRPAPVRPPATAATMLQRWGWYIGAAMLYFGYKAAQEKVATIAAGAAPKKKK